ncbi:hypothetical protein ACFPM3_08375 [Streptomyces coeruleoprunus]|uniref:ATP-binding protein n=1 Tax=Streptomyces coeruleoprunus TaxID=285563 RepID=A0ABV9XBA7_9ACTN
MSSVPPPGAEGTNGPVHTGPGSQHNSNHYHTTNNFYGGGDPDPRTLANDARGKAPQAVADDELQWLRQHFVHPLGYNEADDILEARHTVLLDGLPGSGRRAAARMLLYGRRHDGGRLLELVPYGEDDAEWLDPEQVGDADRLLLDLSDSDAARWPDVRTRLSGFRKAVRDRNARLAVVLPVRAARDLTPEYAALRVEIARPPGLRLEQDLVKRYLRNAGLDATVADPVPDRLRGYLARRPPLREVADVAGLVRDAALAGRPGESFTDWCDTAIDAVVDRSSEVARLVEDRSGAAERALLLSLAMLHAVRPDTLQAAADRLLAVLDHPDNPTPLMERQGLGTRLEEIHAARGDDGLVRFGRPRFGRAVRNHFWENHPDLHPALLAWVGDALTLPGLTPHDRERLVTRFAEQCAGNLRPADLFAVVGTWADRTARGPGVHAAARLLTLGLEDPRLDAACRAQIYEWSTDAHLSKGLRRVLVGVCFAVMPVRHPYQAVVRLHHLAAREGRSGEARDALVELVRGDRRLHRWTLDRLVRPAVGRDRATDLALFLALAAPEPLLDAGGRAFPLLAEAGVRRSLVDGWRSVFASAPREQWRPVAGAWLDAARAPRGELLLDVLVAAAAPRADALVALHAAARARPVSGAARTALLTTLIQKITEARRSRSAGNEEA